MTLLMEQIIGLGNQQERALPMSEQKDCELSYLAGLFDGEGYVGVTINRNRGATPQYFPRCSIVNTNPIIIDEAIRILQGRHVPFHLCHWDAKLAEQKPRMTIDMTGFKRCLRFLWTIEPYLVAKKQQAQMVTAFICSRLSHGKSYKHTPYTDDEINLFQATRELNAKGRAILREHTSRAADFAAKMCSELRAKGAEATEMMAHLERGKGWSRQ